MAENDVKITIIGAGVVGLAIAYELSASYDNIYVIDKNRAFGEETSSRSSEVVHSGIYYPTNSLKTKLCVSGRKLLYKFCDEYRVTYNKCGKLIIASSEEEFPKLKNIRQQGIDNGLSDIQFLSADEVSTLEPNISAFGALLVPQTGVVDSYGFMRELETCSKNKGIEFVYKSKVIDLNQIDNGFEVVVKEGDGASFSFTSEIIINAAGLHADEISNLLENMKSKYELHYCKGEYFAIGNGKNTLVNRLIYPLPNPNLTGLGVHATKDVDAGLKLGPNAFYLFNRDKDYTVDVSHRDDFYNSAKRFLPFLEKEDLYPAYSGIRPKLQKPGDPFTDFVIKEEIDKGYKNYYNLVGIESPGLTSSLAIGKYIKELINNK